MKKDKMVIIVGSTASGKSDLGVKIALQFNGEIISADSRQVYRGMDIGSGKITKEEMKGVPHYLLDIADPKDRYSVSDFKRGAGIAVQNILEKNKLPIIVGGTFFYIDALVYDMDLPEVPPNEKYREELEKKSNTELLSMLDMLDSDRGESIDRKNRRRIIRSLEIAYALGFVPAVRKKSAYDAFWIGIKTGAELRANIETRLTERINAGMIKEAENLIALGLTHNRMEELGLKYRYLSRYLRDDITFDSLRKELADKIWQYSKRQLTWLRRNKDIHWYQKDEMKAMEEDIKVFLSE